MNVRKTASLLRKELIRRGYRTQSVDQCVYYVQDVLSNDTTIFRSKDYVDRIDGHSTFPKKFTIDLTSL